MGPAESDLVGLIGLIYDVLQNPPRWAEFLEQYARALGAYVTFIHRHRFRERSSEIVTSFGLSSPIRAAYHAHYSAMNVWRNTGEHLYVAGHILRAPEIMPRPVLVKSEFYNDFLFPISGVHSVAAVIAREGEEALVLTALNHYSDRAWDEHDKKPIECVLAHLRRAHAIEQRIQVLEAEETFLDTLEAGVVFLSGDGRLVRLNRAAGGILRQSDGLTVRNGKFVACNSVVDARLQQTIRQDGSGCVPLDAASAIAVPRPSGKRA